MPGSVSKVEVELCTDLAARIVGTVTPTFRYRASEAQRRDAGKGDPEGRFRGEEVDTMLEGVDGRGRRI